MPQLEFLSTGGITFENAKTYWERGAKGVGSLLFDRELIEKYGFVLLKDRFVKFCSIIYTALNPGVRLS